MTSSYNNKLDFIFGVELGLLTVMAVGIYASIQAEVYFPLGALGATCLYIIYTIGWKRQILRFLKQADLEDRFKDWLTNPR
jgi:hypothetical protein